MTKVLATSPALGIHFSYAYMGETQRQFWMLDCHIILVFELCFHLRWKLLINRQQNAVPDDNICYYLAINVLYLLTCILSQVLPEKLDYIFLISCQHPSIIQCPLLVFVLLTSITTTLLLLPMYFSLDRPVQKLHVEVLTVQLL